MRNYKHTGFADEFWLKTTYLILRFYICHKTLRRRSIGMKCSMENAKNTK